MADESWAGVADLHSSSLDEPTLFDKAADFVTKGIPLAAASGVTSILNTGISFGNLFGDFEQIDFAEKVRGFDNNLADYYDEHKAGVDLGGFIGTSLVPGTLGMKGLKALQSLRQGEGIGANVGAVAGYFAAKQEKYLAEAAATLKSPSQALLAGINRDKVLAIAAGFGEEALKGAAFETGVLLTMNQNPVLEPNERDNYVQSLWKHAGQSGLNALLFGGVGGAISGVVTAGKFNKLIRLQDEADEEFKQIWRQGVSNLTEGTYLATELETLHDLRKTLKQMEETLQTVPQPGIEPVVTERALRLQKDTIKQLENDLGTFVTTKFANQKTPEIGKFVWEALNKVAPVVERGYEIPAIELLARFLGGAERVDRVLPAVSKVDEASGLTVHSPTVADKTTRLINLRSGEITDEIYPRASDLGSAEIKNNRLYSNGKVVDVPEDYDPLFNSPTDSSNQFWLAQRFARDNKIEEVSALNIPQLEAAVLRGDHNIKITDYNGLSSNPAEILQQMKNDVIEELTLKGLSNNYISRAVNVPEEYLLTGKGPITLDSLFDGGLQSFENPVYAEIKYTGRKVMDRFMADGLLNLQHAQAVAQNVRRNAGALIFGDDFKSLPTAEGNLVGVGSRSGAATFIASADAERGSTMMSAMQVGKILQKRALQQATDWQNALYGIRQEILTNPEALYLRNINAGKLRAADEDMIRIPDELFPGGTNPNLVLAPRSLVEAALESTDPVAWIQTQLPKIPTQTVSVPLESAEARYLIRRQQLTADQASKWNAANAARGSTVKFHTDAFYEPPINTARQPYFALVSERNPLADLRPQSMIVATSAEKLAEKVAEIKSKLGDLVDVYTKDEIKANKQLDATYESGLLFGKTAVDSNLKKYGILSDFVPRRDGYIFEEENSWIWSQAQAIHRQGVELIYGSEMAELRFLRDGWNQANRKFRDTPDQFNGNPYQQVMNTFLNLSNKSNYDAFWGKLNQGMQAAWNFATDAWSKGYKDATEGKLTFQQAERIAAQAGYQAPFGKVTEEIFRETFRDPNSLSKLVAKVNMAASTLMIRMDPLNALINVMSLPVLLSSESRAVRSALQNELGLAVTVPGTSHQIPSTMKLLYDGIRSFWSGDAVAIPGLSANLSKKQWFVDIGAIRTNPQLIQDSLAIPLSAVNSGEKGLLDYSSKLASTIGELGSKYSGNNLAEELVRYIAADAGLKFAKAQGMTSPGEVAAYVNLIVNRVHGNYLASQRPTIFSGPVGQAIGLFQTYQFNMIQQMTRYLQEGSYRTAGVALAMQNTLFGLQGNPLFWQLNKYIGDANRDHGDVVTGISNVVGSPELGKLDPARWLLYGLGANSLQVNLYNRGDLTPRFTTIVPTSFQDIPAVSIGTKAIGSFLDSMKAVANGAPVADSILQGVAHAGFNRPLAGLASLASGKKTTGSGSLLTAYNDIDGFLVAAKLAGGERLNTAIALDSYYRLQQYKTDETRRLQELGEAVKLTVAGKPGIDPEKTEEFMRKYAEAGGDIKNFNRFMIQQTKNANQSVVDQMKRRVHNPLAQKQLAWLGADVPEGIRPTEETQ